MRDTRFVERTLDDARQSAELRRERLRERDRPRGLLVAALDRDGLKRAGRREHHGDGKKERRQPEVNRNK
jgi:hypothetical protein